MQASWAELWGHERRAASAGAAVTVLALAFWAASAPALFLAQALVGAALGCSWGALAEVVMQAAGPSERDRASGILPVVFSAGFGFGAALFGILANGLGFATAQGPDLRNALLQMIALALVPAVAALAAAARLFALARRGAGGAGPAGQGGAKAGP